MVMNSEGFQKRKGTIPTVRDQRADEKSGVIYLFIMFSSGIVVIKMLEMAHFLDFLQMAAKN